MKKSIFITIFLILVVCFVFPLGSGNGCYFDGPFIMSADGSVDVEVKDGDGWGVARAGRVRRTKLFRIEKVEDADTFKIFSNSTNRFMGYLRFYTWGVMVYDEHGEFSGYGFRRFWRCY